MTSTTYINKKTLLTMLPLADRTIYNMEQRGDFPKRIVLNSRNVVWDLAEIQAWIVQKKLANQKAQRPGLPRAA